MLFRRFISLSSPLSYGKISIEFWTPIEKKKESSPQEDLSFFQKIYPNSLLSFLRQVHGDKVLFLTPSSYSSPFWGEGDAAYTSSFLISPMVRVADCIPILFFHKKKPLWGAIHAGWRSLQKGIIEKTFQNFSQETPFFVVWIGPHIRNYEVQEDVAKLFPQEASQKIGESYLLNLEQIAIRKLYNLGIKEIFLCEEDTLSNPFLASHRRGDKGRNIALIYVRKT